MGVGDKTKTKQNKNGKSAVIKTLSKIQIWWNVNWILMTSQSEKSKVKTKEYDPGIIIIRLKNNDSWSLLYKLDLYDYG